MKRLAEIRAQRELGNKRMEEARKEEEEKKAEAERKAAAMKAAGQGKLKKKNRMFR